MSARRASSVAATEHGDAASGASSSNVTNAEYDEAQSGTAMEVPGPSNLICGASQPDAVNDCGATQPAAFSFLNIFPLETFYPQRFESRPAIGYCHGGTRAIEFDLRCFSARCSHLSFSRLWLRIREHRDACAYMCLYVQSFFRLQHRACSHHSAVLSFSKSQVTRRARNTLCRFRPDGILLGEMLLDHLGEALRVQSSRCASTGPLVHKLARFEMPSIVPSSDFASSTLLSRFHASRFHAWPLRQQSTT